MQAMLLCTLYKEFQVYSVQSIMKFHIWMFSKQVYIIHFNIKKKITFNIWFINESPAIFLLGVNFAWFKNQATNIFVWPANSNMFVSWSGALYVSEVQPTDASKRYFCLITLVGTDDAKLGKGNTLVRSNKGILLLLLEDTSKIDPRENKNISIVWW